jgi:hypothetical protein
MAYVMVKRGKPTMYQSGEREWVCQGLSQVATGTTQRGAYTRWKNLVALAEVPSDEADRLKAANRRSVMTAASILGAMR